MAQMEHDREDLLRDATAYTNRIELTIPELSEEIFIGFRDCGAASFYFGQDLVYHFNAESELRRGYYENKLLKAEDSQLVSMTRNRTDEEVELVRHEFSVNEKMDYLAELQLNLNKLSKALKSESHSIKGQVPENVDLIERVIDWIDDLAVLRVAKQPNVEDC